ncbi:MAG: DNA methyltransferase [Promethearchaeota archaeon]
MELNKIYYENCYEFVHKLPDNFCDLILIDPPSGAGLVKTNWDKKISAKDYGFKLSMFLKRCSFKLKETGSIYLSQWIGEKNPLHMIEVIKQISERTDLIFKELCTWKKQRGHGARKGWLQVNEHCLWYINNTKSFIWNRDYQYTNIKKPFTITGSANLSDFYRRTTVWNYMEIGMGTSPKKFKEEREKFGKCETPKPLEYYKDKILLHTKPGDVVFIPFSGSGVAENVCKELGRNFISCELYR